MDINQEMQKALDFVVETKLPTMMEKAATDMLQGIVSDMFSKYGESAKKVKAEIEKKLDVNLDKYDLVDYNALVAKVINDNLVQQVNLEPISELIKNTVGFIEKKTINLSEIVQMFEEASMEQNEQEGEGKFSVHVEKHDKYEWVTVSLDLEEDVKASECEIEFTVHKDGTLSSFRSGVGYRTKRSKPTPFSVKNLDTLQAKIYRLYSAGVKVEVDEMDFSNAWSRY